MARNSEFRMKQFLIQQEHCAMKVSTDAALFGALAPIPINDDQVLDIGAGTGILSLMIAQKNNNARIIALEINPQDARQCQENIDNSPYCNIEVVCTDILNFNVEKKFNFIIVNPPYFEGQLISENQHRNRAHHSTDISLLQLIKCIHNLLQDSGEAMIMLPLSRLQEFKGLCVSISFHIHRLIMVHDRPEKAAHIFIAFFAQEIKNECEEQVFMIKNEDHSYSEMFKNLLSPYYLYL
jgi:tRNA1Val (adenine37-N6)-methyltransferase